MSKTIRVRFAPSPTGLLHIGGVRTALFNYIFAKQQNGKFILRLEDTDRERFVEDSISQIEQSLRWLGIEPDEGIWLGKHSGAHGPYIQSERMDHYIGFATNLLNQGLAYYSKATPDDINDWRETAKTNKQPFIYKRQLESKISLEETLGEASYPIRIDSKAIGQKLKLEAINWVDELRGEFSSKLTEIDDFIILKSDGFPTYNFANVIDDHLMKISHVIRGDEFISSTAKHCLLYRALELETPKFVHLPAILGPDGKKKLSKRDGDVNVLDYKTMGYLPDALINFLALLGWNDGTKQEIFSLDEVIEKFSLTKIQKSPAVFDRQRLDWMNGMYLRSLKPAQFASQCVDFLPAEWRKDQKYLQSVLTLEQERVKKLSEIAEMIDFFFEKPIIDIGLLTAKSKSSDVALWLERSIRTLKEVDFTHQDIESCLRQLALDLDIKTGELFYVIRIALTGRTAAPGLFDTLLTLGKEQSLDRLSSAQKLIIS